MFYQGMNLLCEMVVELKFYLLIHTEVWIVELSQKTCWRDRVIEAESNRGFNHMMNIMF